VKTSHTASNGERRCGANFPTGSVIIPAHNEAAVIERTLRPLAPLAAGGDVEIIVVCNGCVDNTAELARKFSGVLVLDIPQPSKVIALNTADAAASRWPRLYLDADVEIEPQALREVFETLERGNVLAARPAFRYEFYRARTRIPSTNRALWGAGAFALTEKGHFRFGEFPLISSRFSGDDLFVDHQFAATEKAVLETSPVMVRTPRHAKSLLAVLRRNYRAQAELRDFSTTARTLAELLGSISSRRSAIDACVYAVFVVLARLRRPRVPDRAGVWERDESSRLLKELNDDSYGRMK
jgi:glycosyltransferase involved in cell wall biosynthesis